MEWEVTDEGLGVKGSLVGVVAGKCHMDTTGTNVPALNADHLRQGFFGGQGRGASVMRG